MQCIVLNDRIVQICLCRSFSFVENRGFAMDKRLTLPQYKLHGHKFYADLMDQVIINHWFCVGDFSFSLTRPPGPGQSLSLHVRGSVFLRLFSLTILVSVLLSPSVKRVNVSHMQDFSFIVICKTNKK